MSDHEISTFAETCDCLAAYAQMVADNLGLHAVVPDAIANLETAAKIFDKHNVTIPDSMAAFLRRAAAEKQ